MIQFHEHIWFKGARKSTTSFEWMFGETPVFHVKIWNHPIETTIYKWMFQVPGTSKSWSCFVGIIFDPRYDPMG